VNSTAEYQRLCALDVLGLADNVGADSNILDEFKEQLTTSEQGYYETRLPWKAHHKPLLSNMNGSLQRLHPLLRKLKRTDMLSQYDAIIREQIEQGILEKAPTSEFYFRIDQSLERTQRQRRSE